MIALLAIPLIYMSDPDEEANSDQPNKIHFVGDLAHIQDILVLEDRSLIKTASELYQLSYKDKKLNKIPEPGGKYILSQCKQKVYFCQWENFIIYEPNQTATITRVYSEELKLLHQQESSNTSMPTYCDEKTIKFTDAFPFQSNHSPKKIPNQLSFTGTNKTTLQVGTQIIANELPIENIFTWGYTSDDLQKAIFQDTSGGIWLVEIPP